MSGKRKSFHSIIDFCSHIVLVPVSNCPSRSIPLPVQRMTGTVCFCMKCNRFKPGVHSTDVAPCVPLQVAEYELVECRANCGVSLSECTNTSWSLMSGLQGLPISWNGNPVHLENTKTAMQVLSHLHKHQIDLRERYYILVPILLELEAHTRTRVPASRFHQAISSVRQFVEIRHCREDCSCSMFSICSFPSIPFHETRSAQ